ncbi:MAG: winged helix-turn-helix domain-containing protein [Candidatus Pacebacteria bacterium]|nr:winged helix-turn-helix domain-containing protein [Candidatus Paceibacterota bacterium]
MQKQNVKIGKNYVAKIDDALIVVKIEAEHKSGGWIATDVKTNRQLRIATVRKLKREANDAESKDTAPKSAAKNSGKKLTAQFAYETWRQNNVFPGLFIFELPENFLMFGSNAELTAGILKRQKQLAKKSFTFSGKKTSEHVLALKGPEIFGVMKNLAISGNTVLLVTQKKDTADGNCVAEYEISKHIIAGRDKIIDGLPPREMVVKKAGQCTYRVRNNARRKMSADIQHIEIKPGETFKSQSGNEYQIQMVSETAVYAQQLRDGKPAGPTRPFDKKSIAEGFPKGLRDEDSYYPKSEALDAAEKVLNNADSPMDAKSIIIEIRKRKLWFTTARTPHTTLAAAISRDINRNGNSSRFQRIGRGLYQLTNKPAAKQPVKTAKSKTPAKSADAKTVKPKVKKTAKKAVKKVVKKTTTKTTQKTPKTKK